MGKIPIWPGTGENDIANVKWFVLGAAISGNIRLWTGSGSTNKYTVNLSNEGNVRIETETTNENEEE